MNKRSEFLRMWKILSLAFTVFVQIYWYKLLRKSDQEWEELWGTIGRRFRKTLFELEGLLIKIGQFLSIRSDLLPKAFIQEIEDLVDRVPPSKWQEIKGKLETEWNSPIEQKLASIDEVCIASASIGEVYQATLRNGQKVAIKVQRPNIRSIVKTDFRSLAIIMWFADHFVPMPKGFINFKVLYQELKQVIERELEFNKEVETLQYFKNRFKNLTYLKIPEVHLELCTNSVMVMEWVEGKKVTEPNLLESLSIERKEVAGNLLELFLPQWLEAGIFHADPHAGNVLVNAEGKIVLLDYGMIGEISKQDAKQFQELIEGILAKDYKKVVSSLERLGFLLPEAEPKIMEKLLEDLMAIDMEQLKTMDMLVLKKEMNDIVQALPIQVPTRFIFLARSFITIEGMVRTIAPEEELVDLAKPVFMDWLSNQGTSKWNLIWQWLNAQPLFKVFHSANEFLKLPERLEEMKELEQRRQFQFTIYENQKKRWFQLILIGLLISLVGYYLRYTALWKGSLGLDVVGVIGFIVTSYKQKQWLRFMHSKRRN